MTLLGALAAAAALAAPAPVAPAPANDVARMVDFIKANKGPAPAKPKKAKPAEKSFSFTEADVNAYIQRWIETEQTKAKRKEVVIKSGQVRFLDGHVIVADAVARVDVGSMKALDSLGDSMIAKTVKEALSMDNSLHLAFAAGAAKGKGYVVIKEVKLKGIPVPAALVREILAIVGKHQRPPLDFNKLLDLPNGIQKVDVEPGSVKLEVAPKA